MGCVHTHWGRLASEECGNMNCIQNVVEKIEENNQKVQKVGQVISHDTLPSS
jgi:hypothetical protein